MFNQDKIVLVFRIIIGLLLIFHSSRVWGFSQLDIPEEVDRNQVILEAISPIDGSRMTPADYAQLESVEPNILPPELQKKNRIQRRFYLLNLLRSLPSRLKPGSDQSNQLNNKGYSSDQRK